MSAVRRLAGEKLIVGVSAHTVEEAVKAARGGADYLGLGAVFSTSTKADAGAMSRDTLKAICQAVDLPKVAIGGISAENILQLSGSGVDGWRWCPPSSAPPTPAGPPPGWPGFPAK